MAGVIDLSGFSYFIPLLGFLLVFIVIYALLKKLKILGDNDFIILLTSFVIGVIFVSVTSVRQAVTDVVPWFAVLIVALFFIFMIIGFSQGKFEKAPSWLMWIFVLLIVSIFLVSLLRVFGTLLYPYLPGYDSGSQLINGWKDFLYSSKVAGAILLLVIAGISAWVLTKKK